MLAQIRCHGNGLIGLMHDCAPQRMALISGHVIPIIMVISISSLVANASKNPIFIKISAHFNH
jgi:hypothetical protein